MVTQDLLNYIKQQLQMGKSQEEISSALTAQGWQATDVQQAFANINSPSGVPIPLSADLPKARQIFDESWIIFKNRYKTLIGINLIPILGTILFALIVGALAVAGAASHTATQTPGFIVFVVIGLILFLAFLYLCLWSTIAQLYAIKDQAEGIGWKEAFKRSKPTIWMFFGTSLLTGLAVLGGFILFIIPGIIFCLWFSQSPYIVVEEGLSGSEALKRSKYYVKGRIGQIFGKLFYIGIITIGLYIVIGILLGIFNAITKLNPAYTSWISNVFSLIWTPVVTVYGYQVYKHARASRP